jgi:hypothetical protein
MTLGIFDQPSVSAGKITVELMQDLAIADATAALPSPALLALEDGHDQAGSGLG